MAPDESCTEKSGLHESRSEGESRGASPRDSGVSSLPPSLTRAIVEQLLQHGRELGRREMIDLLGVRYGWNRPVSDPNVPAPASLDA